MGETERKNEVNAMDDFKSIEFVNADVLVDGKMVIVAADEGFEAISGNDAYLVFTRYIHEDDINRFKKFIGNYDSNNNPYIVIRMLYADKTPHWMLLRIGYDEASNDTERRYKINIMDTASVTMQIDKLNKDILSYACYLGLSENIMLSYDIGADWLRIFMVTDGQQTMCFYDGALGDWIQLRIATDRLEGEAVRELDTLKNTLINGEKFFKREITANVLGRAGHIDKCFIRGKTVTDNNGSRVVLGVITILETSNGDTVEELSVISDMKDPGTDLLNKRAITDYVRNLIDSKPGHNVTIAIIDVDDFKTINDTYGHMFGDEVLYKVADVLRDAVGRKGLCGRIGGDEMFIVMEGLNGDEGIRNVLRTVRNNVTWLYHDDPRNINRITCSIGSASYPNDAKDYDELFKVADKMLYLAKEKGKNRYIIYHEDIHKRYVYDMGEIVDVRDKVFYKYRKMTIVNVIIREYRDADAARRQELLEMVALAFNIDNITIYDQSKMAKYVIYGDEEMAEDDGSYFKKDNYLPGFREDGILSIDNVNFFETKAPAMYEIFSKYGIIQAVQYIIGGTISDNDNNEIISYNRFKQDKKWAEMDMNFLAIIGDYVGNIYLREKEQ